MTLGIGCLDKPDVFDPCVPIPGSNGSAINQVGIKPCGWLDGDLNSTEAGQERDRWFADSPLEGDGFGLSLEI
jgi:hypothetical protein